MRRGGDARSWELVGRTVDSVRLKVRRDKRFGPDGAEEPLAATAYMGGWNRSGAGPGLVLSRGRFSVLPETATREKERDRGRGRGGMCSCAFCARRRMVAPAVRDCLARPLLPGPFDVSRGAASRFAILAIPIMEIKHIHV